VSSPGVDRPLVTRAHFAAVVSSEIRVTMAEHLEGRRRFKGRLLRVDESVIDIEVDGEVFELPLAGIEKARLVSGEQP
jgi:ribosome maturation factor RimP